MPYKGEVMYLITYNQAVQGRAITANAVIKTHPFKWLTGSAEKYPEANTTLLNFWELSEEEFDKLSQHY